MNVIRNRNENVVARPRGLWQKSGVLRDFAHEVEMNIHISGNGSGLEQWHLVAIVIAFVIASAAIKSLLAAKRRKLLAEWSARLGLSFEPGKDHSFEHTFREFEPLRRGSGQRHAFNICSGMLCGHPLQAFDYHYVTQSRGSKGRRKTIHHEFSAVLITSDVPLKPLHVSPEGIFDKIAEAFGFNDIDFESAEFSRKYKVTAPDRKWASDVLHARAIEFLLSKPQASLQFGCGRYVLVWSPSGKWTPAEFEQAAGVAAGLLDLLPEFLREQQRAVDTA